MTLADRLAGHNPLKQFVDFINRIQDYKRIKKTKRNCEWPVESNIQKAIRWINPLNN